MSITITIAAPNPDHGQPGMPPPSPDGDLTVTAATRGTWAAARPSTVTVAEPSRSPRRTGARTGRRA